MRNVIASGKIALSGKLCHGAKFEGSYQHTSKAVLKHFAKQAQVTSGQFREKLVEQEADLKINGHVAMSLEFDCSFSGGQTS